MKRLYVLLEDMGATSFFTGEQVLTSDLLFMLLKNKDTFREIIKLISSESNPTIKEMILILKEYVKRSNKIFKSAEIISQTLSKGGKKLSMPIQNSNYFLDIIYNLGKIGNYDCSTLTLDEAMYFLMRNNIEVESAKNE